MKQGWVYVLTNPAMPGLIKIGFTKNPPQERARELYGTGVAYPFEVAYQVRCHRYQAVERAAHIRLADKRVNDGREFFACTVEEAARVIRECAGEHLIAAQDMRDGGLVKHENEQDRPSSRPSENIQTASGGLRLRHYLFGGGMVLVALLIGFVGFGRDGEAVEISETQQLIGYAPTKIGNEDINMRACSSTDCAVVSVLPAKQNILIKPETRTGKNWVYAEFHGDVCYPQHYERGAGCRQWAKNNIVEGWVYLNNLQWQPQKKKSDSIFDSLF